MLEQEVGSWLSSNQVVLRCLFLCHFCYLIPSDGEIHLSTLFSRLLGKPPIMSQVWLLQPSRLVSSVPSLTLVIILNWLVVVTTMLLPSAPRQWRYSSRFLVGSRRYWGCLWPRSSACMYPSRSHSCKMVSGEGWTCQGPSWQHQHGSYPASPQTQIWWWQVCHPHYRLPCSPEQGSPKNPPLVSLWRAQNMNHSSLKCHHILKPPYRGSVKYTWWRNPCSYSCSDPCW